MSTDDTYLDEMDEALLNQILYQIAVGVKSRVRPGRTSDQSMAEVLAAITPEAILQMLAIIQDRDEQRALEVIVHGEAGADRLEKKRWKEYMKGVQAELEGVQADLDAGGH